MILTDDIVHIHMPKTGGTWVQRVMTTETDAKAGWHLASCKKYRFSGHSTAMEVSEYFADHRYVGTLRDPWRWYQSWYQHCLKRMGGLTHAQDALAKYDKTGKDKHMDKTKRALLLYGNGSLSFKPVLYGMTHPWELDELPPKEILLNPWGEDMEIMERGLFSHFVRWFYQNPQEEWIIDTLMDTAQLTQGVSEIFGVDQALLEKHQKINVGKYEKDVGKWDSEMKQWVYESDAKLIELLQCSPFKPFPEPTVGVK